VNVRVQVGEKIIDLEINNPLVEALVPEDVPLTGVMIAERPKRWVMMRFAANREGEIGGLAVEPGTQVQIWFDTDRRALVQVGGEDGELRSVDARPESPAPGGPEADAGSAPPSGSEAGNATSPPISPGELRERFLAAVRKSPESCLSELGWMAMVMHNEP